MALQIKKISHRILMTANAVAILLMLLIGSVDMLNPVDHHFLSTLGLGFPVILLINLGFLIFWAVVRWKSLWLPVLGFIICFIPVRKYCPLNMQEEPPRKALKVLTYNVWLFDEWDVGEGESNQIVDYLIDSDADIMCLQEATFDGSKSDNPMARLKQKYAYCDTVKRVGDHLMVVSKYPIKNKHLIEYESKGNMSAAFVVDVKGRDVLVINNHLESNKFGSDDKEGFKDLVKGDLDRHEAKGESKRLISKLGEAAAIRAPQADIVAALVDSALQKRMPVIVCGDFNDNPISYTRRTISQNLIDCFISSGFGPGISYHKSGMLVRIDHMMCSDDFRPYSAQIDTKIKASDHYPMVCWLEMRRKP